MKDRAKPHEAKSSTSRIARLLGIIAFPINWCFPDRVQAEADKFFNVSFLDIDTLLICSPPTESMDSVCESPKTPRPNKVT